jgi:uncharacterized protein YsxB (DUF464 family)
VIRVRADLADGRFRLDVDGHEGRVVGGRVCAAVSAITQTALLGLEEIARQFPDLVSVEITQEKQ